MEKREIIVIIDLGSPYTQLIAREIRREKVYCEIFSHRIQAKELKELSPKGIILAGGQEELGMELLPDKDIFQLGCPVLGLSYGMEVMVHLLGGQMDLEDKVKPGQITISVDTIAPLFEGLDEELDLYMSGGRVTKTLPNDFHILSYAQDIPAVAIGDIDRGFYGLQFEPELPLTQYGQTIIRNFLFNVCNASGSWTAEYFIENEVKEIRAEVGDGRVICGLSGGIDSSAAALLVHKAIGDRLTCIFVDHGMLRKGEAESVEETFRENFKMNLVYVDAASRFLDKLEGVVDPELKRKIIGEEFIRVFEEEAKKLGKIDFLVQGTLYSDVIESSPISKTSSVRVKSHHNVGGLPEKMDFKLVEPFRNLFKDEVRLIGAQLGLPEAIVGRHPFPGPGLAVRIVGDITRERLHILQEADAIVIEEIKKAGLYKEIWQAFAVLTSIRTVGVRKSQRTYDYVIAIRAVTSDDGMTCKWYRLPYDVLDVISTRIVHEVDGVNRVVYDISNKPPATIEWE